MGSFAEDLEKLRKDDNFGFWGAILILGLVFAAVVVGFCYGMNILITTFGWTVVFEVLIVIFFILAALVQLSSPKQENIIVKVAKITGVSIIIAIFIAAILIFLGGNYVFVFGFIPPLVIFWILGVAYFHFTTPTQTTYYTPRE